MNDFYTIHELQPSLDSLSCIIVFNGSHHIFDGHFPGQPVVPGVCMVQMVKELLQQQFDKSLILRSTGQIKFLQLITPEVMPEIHISWKETDNGYLVNAGFKKDTDLFKLTGTFEIL